MKKRVPRPIPASKFLGSHDKRVVGTSRSWQSDDMLTGAELSTEPAEPEGPAHKIVNGESDLIRSALATLLPATIRTKDIIRLWNKSRQDQMI
jgi:hypothetical protein